MKPISVSRIRFCPVQEQLLEVQAIFLHVATYNKAAVQLYESLNFFRLEHFPAFYQIHGWLVSIGLRSSSGYNFGGI